MGKAVLTAVKNVNETLARELIGESVFDQNKIDRIMIELDGTPNKSKWELMLFLGFLLQLRRLQQMN